MMSARRGRQALIATAVEFHLQTQWGGPALWTHSHRPFQTFQVLLWFLLQLHHVVASLRSAVMSATCSSGAGGDLSWAQSRGTLCWAAPQNSNSGVFDAMSRGHWLSTSDVFVEARASGFLFKPAGRTSPLAQPLSWGRSGSAGWMMTHEPKIDVKY